MYLHSVFFLVASVAAAVSLWKQYVQKVPVPERLNGLMSAALLAAYLLK